MFCYENFQEENDNSENFKKNSVLRDKMEFLKTNETAEKEEGKPPPNKSFNPILRILLIHHIASFFNLYIEIVRKKQKICFQHIRLLGKFRNLKILAERLSYLFDDFIQKENCRPTNFQFLKLFFKIFGWPLFFIYILWTFHTFLLMSFSIFLDHLLENLNNYNEKNKYISAIILSLSLIFQTFLQNQCWNLTLQISVKIRSTIILLLYKKIIALNNYNIQKANIGKLINIIANDMNVIEFRFPYVILLFSSPFSLIFCIYLVWSKLGVISSLIAILIFVLINFFQMALSNANSNNIKAKNINSDERIKTCSEMIEGIRLLKMYGWEIMIKNLIDKIRAAEIKNLNSYWFCIMGDRGISINSSTVVSLFAFFSFYLINNNDEVLLKPSLIFSVYLLLQYARTYQVVYVGAGLSVFYELKIACNRILDIITIQEKKTKVIKHFDDQNSEYSLIIKNYNSYWDINSTQCYLSNINMTLKKGCLYSLIGPVGSGKSSLFYSILGEVPKFDGFIISEESVAYVEQNPFIMTGSVRDNILFHKSFDNELYEKVVTACCLKKDFSRFANEDLTEIGEKGINLSGGQKARISLARALYSEAEFYLLDDPISALDAKIGRKVFNRAIKGFLKKKCILLITHQTQYLKDVDYIFLMEKGKIIKEGNFNFFNNILSGYFDENDENEKQITEEMAEENAFLKKNKWQDIQINNEGKLLHLEEKEETEIDYKTYYKYFSYAKSHIYLIALFFMYILSETNRYGATRLLSQFGQNEMSEESIFVNLFLVTLSLICLDVIKYFILCKLILICNQNIHEKMSDSIVRAPVVFFDTRQTGVILSRFSNDLALIDNQLAFALVDSLDIVIGFLAANIIIGVLNPWYFLIVLIVCWILLFIFINGKKIILGLREFDLLNKNPVFAFLNTSLAGITTINVYRKNEEFESVFIKTVEKSMRCNFDLFDVSRGFTIIVDITVKISAIIGIFLTIWLSEESAGVIGQQVIYLLSMSEDLNWGLRQFIKSDSIMSSGRRAMMYGDIPPEDSLVKKNDSLLKNEQQIKNNQNKWPSNGNIAISNVDLKYNPSSASILIDFNLNINSGEKIGVVGRTGAGKSSLIQALFRMYEVNKGEIKIDDIDIKTVGLHTLRKRISIIPQIPFVFNESIRKNLDPLEIYSEKELWQSLDDVELKIYVSKLEKSLETKINNNTNIFSVGQKQLLCLARAILQKNQILVLDEATANIDLETDKIIQKKIKEIFALSTVVTIAHRLLTIVDFDKVVVIEKGKIVEFENPFKLLVNNIDDEQITRNGYFADMVKSTGIQPSKNFFKTAKKAYFEKHKF